MHSTILFHKQLGDLVLLQPAVARLFRTSGRPVHLLTRPAFKPILELFGPETIQQEASAPCKELYVFERGSKPAWKAWCRKAGKKHLILSEKREQRWFHPAVFDEIIFDSTFKDYRARYYWNHVPGGEEDVFVPPQLNPPPAEWSGRYPGLEGQVLIHPTSAWKRKCWQVAKWRESMKALQDVGVGPFLVTSGPEAWEVEHAHEIANGFGVEVQCLAGQTTLKELITQIHRSRLVLAVDGAVAHLAAALGRRSVVLFGPANPIHWYFPTEQNLVLSARDYTAEIRPSADFIPSHHLAEKALALWQ